VKVDFLLCCVMGSIAEASAQQFTIQLASHALEPLSCIGPEPFASFEAALTTVENHSRSGVRCSPDEDQR
jgi:hypothetical protein